ncbi:MAG: TlyA family RNA methyltransferase [Spirochaetes bacterium]|jgi:23S rRNA (cytidine1920-2'-O)/16S rRNA (cytidine1409-2'-O)-methyltransferase|nr:TlyA family RNA methyltransferase [Spirochaetota bacterium]
MKKGTRLDKFLSESGLSKSREKALKEILAGWIKVDGETVRTPSRTVSGDENITVLRPGGLFVSRGGEKLFHALKTFNVSVKGMTAADIGSSTGGFTHCLLENGAVKVYAVDVGYGQLDYSLRSDPRVVVMERTNVRSLTPASFNGDVEFITADLSFISITKAYDKIMEIFQGCDGIMLIKPQFEADPGEHKKGVVRKEEAHRAILARVIGSLLSKGMSLKGLTHSPMKGPAGNIEFLAYFNVSDGKGASPAFGELNVLIGDAVKKAHDELD